MNEFHFMAGFGGGGAALAAAPPNLLWRNPDRRQVCRAREISELREHLILCQKL